ncbi:hypothetical protein B0H14DRAFT_3445662 [Mycena olivaceomarginata]|nr:hypothetical protein B0H14DRAFT_3445662 [Mycena olivaceomarginata]
MRKNTSQKAALTPDWGEQQLEALRIPFPDGVDPRFRHPSDELGDFMSAYRRSVIFIAKLGDNRVAYLWQQALTIGFRAGRADTMDAEGPHDPTASEDFALGREAGLKEGRTGGLRDGKHDGRKAGKMQGLKEGEAVGFEKGKAEGLDEGKRLGFVAGRDFGEKQALKMSKTSASERVLVDVGTDSPVANLAPPPPPSSAPIHASTQTDTPPATVTPSTTPSPPFTWADEPYAPNPTPSPPPTPRDFSALCSDSTSFIPFSTLQYRAHRQKSARPSRPSAFYLTSQPLSVSWVSGQTRVGG